MFRPGTITHWRSPLHHTVSVVPSHPTVPSAQHHHKVHALQHAHKAMHTIKPVGFTIEAIRESESAHTELVHQAIDFITQYMAATADEKTDMLQSDVWKKIRHQAYNFCEFYKELPPEHHCPNRLNMSIIFFHLDIILGKDLVESIGTIDILLIIIEQGKRNLGEYGKGAVTPYTSLRAIANNAKKASQKHNSATKYIPQEQI